MNDTIHLDAITKYQALEAAASKALHYHKEKLATADEKFGQARTAYFNLLSACESYPNRADMREIRDKAARLFVKLQVDTGRMLQK